MTPPQPQLVAAPDAAGVQHAATEFSCPALEASPYVVLSPVVWNVSQEMPDGSRTQAFSELA
jgi:hypothetical protein